MFRDDNALERERIEIELDLIRLRLEVEKLRYELIRRTLDRNSEAVERVREGRSQGEFLPSRFGFVTGREAVMEPIGSPIRLRDTYGVGVVIRHDEQDGFRVVSAFPRNYNPRIGR